MFAVSRTRAGLARRLLSRAFSAEAAPATERLIIFGAHGALIPPLARVSLYRGAVHREGNSRPWPRTREQARAFSGCLQPESCHAFTALKRPAFTRRRGMDACMHALAYCLPCTCCRTCSTYKMSSHAHFCAHAHSSSGTFVCACTCGHPRALRRARSHARPLARAIMLSSQSQIRARLRVDCEGLVFDSTGKSRRDMSDGPAAR
eukprot:3246987-Pleurochrysis_carterae.AAC.2